MIDEHRFTVMGSTSRVVVNADHPAPMVRWAVDRLRELESLWSRFRPDSEVSQLNRGDGLPTIVSPETATLFSYACIAWQETDGVFDATMLSDLESHGYDRTHRELHDPAESPHQMPPSRERGRRRSRCGEIDVSTQTSTVTLPAGVTFDPGGIGKGLAADMVAEELIQRGAAGAMIELGGDVRVIGEHPDNGPTWTVEVDDPGHLGATLFSLGLADGGIATSSQCVRRWGTSSGDRHHLLDARTGQPASSPVAAAVVASGSAAWAEIAAKVSVVAGYDHGSTLISSSGSSGVLFGFDGDSHDVGLMAAAGPA